MEQDKPTLSPEFENLINRSKVDYKKFVSDAQVLLERLQELNQEFLLKTGRTSYTSRHSKADKFFFEILDRIRSLDKTYKDDLKRALLLHSSLRENAYRDFRECMELELESLRKNIDSFFAELPNIPV